MIKKILALLFFITLSSPLLASPQWLNTISSTIDSDGHNPKELSCLSLTVYHEARGESERGQRMVASVVMNRVRSPKFPNTVCGVVFQKSQFSYLRKSDLTPRETKKWQQAVRISKEYINKGTSEWSFLYFDSIGRNGGTKVGNHYFR